MFAASAQSLHELNCIIRLLCGVQRIQEFHSMNRFLKFSGGSKTADLYVQFPHSPHSNVPHNCDCSQSHCTSGSRVKVLNYGCTCSGATQ